VISTNSNGCSDTSNCVFVDLTGIDDLSDVSFEVFPNPIVNSFEINFDQPFQGEIEIVDLTGKIIFQAEIDNRKNVKLDFPGKSGTYFLNVFNKRGFEQIQLIKL
jgi:glucose dehydrogenase